MLVVYFYTGDRRRVQAQNKHVKKNMFSCQSHPVEFPFYSFFLSTRLLLLLIILILLLSSLL